MKTVEFLRAVLPAQGVYFASEMTPNKHFRNTAFTDIQSLAMFCRGVSKGGHSAYMALSGYKYAQYTDDNGKTKTRTAHNAEWMRSFWMDVDVGKGADKGYDTRRAALAALSSFLKETTLPSPTYVVFSGNGFHLYWVMDTDVPKDSWVKCAATLQTMAKSLGFRVDPSRTADAASVLRPVGTINPKGGKTVDVVGGSKSTHKAKRLMTAILKARKALGINPPKPRAAPTTSVNSEFIEGVLDNFQPSDAIKIAEQCAVIKHMRDTKGADQPEPLWRECMGVLVHTEQGDDICHAWSEGYVNYSYDECQTKLEARRVAAGPTTCEVIEQHTELCAACPKRGKIKSPITLGKPEPTSTTEVVTEDGEMEYLPPLPACVADNFRWVEGKGLLKRIEDADGTVVWVKVCNHFLAPEMIYRDEEGSHVARLSIRTRGKWETDPVDIEFGDIAGPLSGLTRAIGSKAGVLASDDKSLGVFVKTWVDDIRNSTDMHYAIDRLGWTADDEFLLGDRLYKKDGSVERKVVAKNMTTVVAGHHVHGDIDTYKQVIDHLYNRDGFQPYQFIWLASFGSIFLSKLSNDRFGIPIVATSTESGLGKTTICQAALAVWGDPIDGPSAHGDRATEYALYLLAGRRRHLPMLVDETSDWDSARVGKFAYSYSSGKPKLQGTASGGLRDNSHLAWTNVCFLTSNNSIVEQLVSNAKNLQQAQLARIVEIPFTGVKPSAADADKIRELWKHSGVAGDAFLKYVVPRIDSITQNLFALQNQLNAAGGNQTSNRFWVMAAASTLVAAAITKRMGLHNFDMTELKRWTVSLVRSMRTFSADEAENMGDVMAEFVSDVYHGLLVTTTEGARGAVAPIAPGVRPPTGPITGRVITSTGDMFVPVKVVRKWCSDKGVSANGMKQWLMGKKWMIDPNLRTYLGRGTAHNIPQTRCWHLNWVDVSKHLNVVLGSHDEGVSHDDARVSD